MNSYKMAVKLLLLVLAIILISSACTDTDISNVEQCTVKNQPDRVKRVKEHLDGQLKDLVKPGKFEYEVFPIPPAAVGVRFKGTLTGYTGGVPTFHRLSTALNAGIIKSNCVGRVEYLASEGATTETTETESSSPKTMSLIWTPCDPPEELCPNGQCSSSCRGKIYK